MPSTSHRRCQYQGEGCMGTAHAGHDQCAWCYFQYVKPAIQAERKAVKGRRALKRRLSAQNRNLINEVDLKEPLPRLTNPIRNAIYDVELERLVAGKSENEALEAVSKELLRVDLERFTNVPVVLEVPPQKEEPPVQNATPEPTWTRHVHAGGNDSHLTEAQVQEVIDAYQDGMTVMAICDVCNIATTTLYAILREKAIPLRGRPAAPRKELMPQSTKPVLDAKVEPAPTNGVVSGLTEWVVTYTVTRTDDVTVHAANYEMAVRAAISAAEECSIDTVVGVAKKLP